jgi:hypothetical protein
MNCSYGNQAHSRDREDWMSIGLLTVRALQKLTSPDTLSLGRER